MSTDKLSPEEFQKLEALAPKILEQLTPEQLQKYRAMLEPKTVPRPKTEKVEGDMTARYEIVEIRDGCNLHKFVEEPLSKRSYEKERFLIKRSFLDKVHNRIRFMVVLKSPLKEGDKLSPVSLTDPVPISARNLYTVHTSNALKTALVDLFRKPLNLGGFGGKKLLFIGVIIIVGILGYLIYTGQINFGGLIKF